MDNGKISVRYARALMHLALHEHCAPEVYEGLVRLTDNYSLAINAFTEVLSNPMVTKEEKLQLLHSAIGDPVHPCLAHFLQFVTDKRRESKIFLIALKYQEMYRRANGIVKADVTAATELDERNLNGIREYVEHTFHCTAELHVKTNPALIGGFMIDIEHDRMDLSVVGQLQRLEKELISEKKSE